MYIAVEKKNLPINRKMAVEPHILNYTIQLSLGSTILMNGDSQRKRGCGDFEGHIIIIIIIVIIIIIIIGCSL